MAGNVLSSDFSSDIIYKHTGFSSTISDSFSSPSSGPIGVADDSWSGAAAASGPANLKTYNTNAKANIKSINGNLIANCKTLNTNA